MGLDITAYEKATPIPDHTFSQACYDLADQDYLNNAEMRHHPTYAYVGFEQSFRGLPVLTIEKGTGSDFLRGPCMLVGGETFEFRAGSYSGYNDFRNALSTIALGVHAQTVFDKPDPYRNEPFFELVNFADNEGVIGPEACRDLAEDFRQNPGIRERLLVWGDWFGDAFDRWQKAFELASNGGIVDFH